MDKWWQQKHVIVIIVIVAVIVVVATTIVLVVCVISLHYPASCVVASFMQTLRVLAACGAAAYDRNLFVSIRCVYSKTVT